MKTYPQINPVTGMIIQQQSVMLERLADALQKCLYIIGDPSASADKLWRTDDELNDAYHTSIEALAAYEAVKLEPVANPIESVEDFRARLISGAKGEQL